MNERQQWVWIDTNLTPRTLALHELLAAIHAGAVPTSALAWTEGMSTFVQAAAIPELRDACRLAPPTPSALPAPGDTIKPSGEMLKAWRRTAQLPNPSSSSLAPHPAPPTRPSTVAPPRPGAPNLAASGHRSAFPAPSSGPRHQPSSPPLATPSTPQASNTPAVDPASASGLPAQQGVEPLPPPAGATDTSDASHHAIPTAHSPTAQTPPSPPADSSNKTTLIAVGISATIAAMIGVAALVHYAASSHAVPNKLPDVATSDSSASTSPSSPLTGNMATTTPAPKPPPLPPKPTGPWKPCSPTAMHKRLVVGGSATVAMDLQSVPDKNQISVAFAARNNTAVGFVLDVGSLKVRNSFSRRQGAPIRHVTTLFRHDSVSFHADLDDPEDPIQHLFTLGGTSPVRLGIFRRALTMSTGLGSTPRVLWNLPFSSPLRSLQAHTAGPTAIATLLRSGSALWLAWASPDGKRLSAPQKLPLEGAPLGRCSLGWNGYQLMIAYASQKSSDASSVIHVLRAFPGRTPSSPSTVGVKNATNPGVSGLPDGRWLLTWTAQEKKTFSVQGQTFDPDFKPLGDVWHVSPKRSKTMHSGVGAAASGGVIAYAAPIGKMLEVQAVALSCR